MSYNKTLNKENLDLYFSDLGKLLKKKIHNKNLSVEIIVVGGASILLNYNFRNTTVDIDCIDVHNALMNEVVSEVAIKHNLPVDWINTDFKNTNSYSQKLISYSSYYKTFSGVLNIRTIKDEYLIAMKIVSARKYKNDYSDIYGIVKYLKDNGIKISIEQVDRAIDELYLSRDKVDNDAYEFTKRIIDSIDLMSQKTVRSFEEENLEEIKKKTNSSKEADNIDEILKKI